jgi:hypothetical protein
MSIDSARKRLAALRLSSFFGLPTPDATLDTSDRYHLNGLYFIEVPRNAFRKFNSFTEALCEKAHNLQSDTLKLLLTNTAPSATNATKTDISEIAAGNGYVSGGVQTVQLISTQSSGFYKLVISSVVFSATGTMPAFRYVVLYNDSAPNDELIGYWDIGQSIVLHSGEAFSMAFDGDNGIINFTI